MRAARGRGRVTKIQRARQHRFAQMETLESRRLLATFTVNSTGDAPETPGTLRWAIIQANSTSGPDEIIFNIDPSLPGTIHRITPLSNLPSLNEAVAIRGETQPGYAGTPLIEIDGSVGSSLGVGLTVQAPDISVNALAIVGFEIYGLSSVESGVVTLTSSYIGLGADGGVGRPNGTGVFLSNVGNQIGGTAPGAGNVISGNTFDGVTIFGPNARNNVLEGNFIGTGTDGTSPAGNGRDGVAIVGGTTNNIVGGIIPGAGNRIAHNGAVGVEVVFITDPNTGTPFGNVILGNSITANAALGIDLDPPPGPNPIDPSDDDSGPNGSLNYPVITSAVYEDGFLIIDGTLDAPAGRSYRVEFFTDPGDPSGYGEGETYHGYTVVTVVSGATSFHAELVVDALPTGVLTATTTSPIEGTSEFSFGRAITERISFTVINTNDAGRGSLRQAILNANRVPGRQTIDFDIPESYATNGCYIIQPLTALPLLTEAVNLDATTQPGYDGQPVVELQGQRIITDPGAAANGLVAVANDVRIAGLAINQFAGAGIRVYDAHAAVLEGLFIGTDCHGQAAPGNGWGGIILAGVTGSRIGGLSATLRSVVSGNRGPGGIVLLAGSSGNHIVNTLIGTNRAGSTALANNSAGIAIINSNNNVIGGNTPGLGNLISANASGISVWNSSGTHILGNRIGTDAAGRRVLGTPQAGITLVNAPRNIIGAGGSSAGNVIAGHEIGVRVLGVGSTGNLVQNNTIGADTAARVGLGNEVGIHIQNAGQNTVGGVSPALSNVISGNAIVGLRIDGASASGNAILNNRIGTDRAGRSAVPNGYDGVFVLAPNNRIAGNLVSGNGSTGIQLLGPNARGNVVEKNRVGTDATGTLPLGNRRDGIYINSAPGNTIRNNVVSANGSTGIQLFGAGSSGNIVANNFVGTDANGRTVRGMGNRFGFFLNGAGNNQIGGAGGANRISGNSLAPIFTSIAASAPIVESTQPGIVSGRLTEVTVTFSREMDPQSTTNIANYRLRSATGDPLGIASASYDALRRAVTLILDTPQTNTTGIRITINAGNPQGVRSNLGFLLDGNRDGRPGVDYNAILPG